MEAKDIYAFLKPSLEKLTVAEKKELCILITGQDLKTPEVTEIELPSELPEPQLNVLEALFEDFLMKAYNPGNQSYDFKVANKIIKEHFKSS